MGVAVYFMTFLLILAGLVLLFFGGELLVRGAVDIAERLGVSTLLIGLILVGFGTSTPELLTSVLAVYKDQPGIAVGNVIGSNTANILLILGIAAIIYPLACDKKAFARDGLFMVLATLAAVVLCLIGSMDRIVGIVFVLFLAAYIGVSIFMEKRAQNAALNENKPVQPLDSKTLIKDVGTFGVGLVLLFAGAHFLVNGAIDLARGFGISETIIGLTIVAVGTSLPELVASGMAALKKQSDIAYGNIIGSNIYNILGILGLTGILHPFDVPAQIAHFDIWVMAGATALLMGFSAWGWKISRWKGAVFLGLYVVYIVYLSLSV